MGARSGQPLGGCVEISVAASKLAIMDLLSLSDPFAVLTLKHDDQSKEVTLGHTETLWDELEPVFVKTFLLEATTPRAARLGVTLLDRDSRSDDAAKHDLLGLAGCTVEQVLSAGVGGAALPLHRPVSADKPSGTVTLVACAVDTADPVHELSVRVERPALKLGSVKPFLVLLRQRPDNSWVPVFRSQAKRREADAAYAVDAPRGVTLRSYRGGGLALSTPLRMEMHAHEATAANRLIGATQAMSLASLRRQPNGKRLPLSLGGQVTGEVFFRSVVVKGEHTSAFVLDIHVA